MYRLHCGLVGVRKGTGDGVWVGVGDGVGWGMRQKTRKRQPPSNNVRISGKKCSLDQTSFLWCPIWIYTGSKGLSAQTTRVNTPIYISCRLLQRIYVHYEQCFVYISMSHVRNRSANNWINCYKHINKLFIQNKSVYRWDSEECLATYINLHPI